MDFLQTFSTQDYSIIIALFFAIVIYGFLGVNKLYKTIFGVLLGFSLFSLANLSYISLSEVDIASLTDFKKYMYENKSAFLNITFYLIPILGILTTFNSRFHFTDESSGPITKIIRILFFAPFLIFFYFSIVIRILSGKLFFNIEQEFLTGLQNSNISNLINYLSSESIIFDFITKYSYTISFIGFIFVLYILTIGGLTRSVLLYLKIKFTPVRKVNPRTVESNTKEFDKIMAEATGNLVNK